MDAALLPSCPPPCQTLLDKMLKRRCVLNFWGVIKRITKQTEVQEREKNQTHKRDYL
jgi:hypothetical protein